MMTTSVEALRDRLAAREATLSDLRSRVKSTREDSSKLRSQSTISDIQRRYLSAVAQLETKEKDTSKPVILSTTDAVSSLASQWNKGMEGKKIEKTTVHVKGDLDGARKNFSAEDVPKPSNPAKKSMTKKDFDHGPAEFIVEDGSEVPSWARNQQKLVIRKENARSSVRDVDVRDLQGTVLESTTRDGSEVERTKVELGGNVKAALAMWGKTADEDAKAFARKKEEEKKRVLAAEKAQRETETARKTKAVEAAMKKFAKMQLSELEDEPDDEVELIAFLERKLVLLEKEIKDAEDELEKLEDSQ